MTPKKLKKSKIKTKKERTITKTEHYIYMFICWLLWLIFQSQWTLDKFGYNQDSFSHKIDSIYYNSASDNDIPHQICTLPSFPVLSPTLNCHILNSIDQNTNQHVCGPRFKLTNVSSICSYGSRNRQVIWSFNHHCFQFLTSFQNQRTTNPVLGGQKSDWKNHQFSDFWESWLWALKTSLTSTSSLFLFLIIAHHQYEGSSFNTMPQHHHQHTCNCGHCRGQFAFRCLQSLR